MTEAICGPSNPLQNFQKHTSTDRSLQQDRLAARHHQVSQGFRSQANGNAGLLDPEFEAFQAGNSLAPATQHGFQQSFHPQQRFQTPHQGPQPGGWATDFAKLNISQPSHAPPQFEQMQARHTNNGASWHQDFRSQFNQGSAISGQSPSYAQPSYSASVPSFGYQQPMGYIPSPMTSDQHSSESRWKGKGKFQPENIHDTEAFEREFEAMATEALRASVPQEQTTTTELGHDTMLTEEAPQKNRYMGLDETNQANYTISEEEYAQSLSSKVRFEDDVSPNEVHATAPIESMEQHTRYLQATEDAQERGAPETDEDLAKTAGELLEQVSDNTSTKFHQSNFLALMRQFRDREKRIEGNKVVDVDSDLQSAAVPEQQDSDLLRHGPPEYEMAGALKPPSYKTTGVVTPQYSLNAGTPSNASAHSNDTGHPM